jgi:hypothetical protein
MANFAAVGNHFIGSWAVPRNPDGSQVKSTVFYDNFENLPRADPTQSMIRRAHDVHRQELPDPRPDGHRPGGVSDDPPQDERRRVDDRPRRKAGSQGQRSAGQDVVLGAGAHREPPRLLVDFQMDEANGTAERRCALEMLDDTLPGKRRITLTADKGLDTRDFRFIGFGPNQIAAYMIAAAYNLLRIGRRLAATG